MSNLGPQQQNNSYEGLLQIPGGVTRELQQVQDGYGQTTGLWVSSTGATLNTADSFTISENGVTVPNAVPRLISDGFGDYISVKDFGAIGDGSTDDTAAIQKAITYCVSHPVSSSGTLGGGMRVLFFPAGVYKVSSTLTVTGANGFCIYGAGKQATQIIFTATSSTLLSYTTYLHCEIKEISFLSGSVSIIGGLPTYTPDATKSNTAISFNSTGSGAFFFEENNLFASWGTVYSTIVSAINGDNHRHNNCTYFSNAKVWNNTNPQAVVWSFTDCIAYYNDNVFVNPGVSAVIRGGDYINPGIFLTVGLLNTSQDILVDGANFENYQNIDPSAAPQFISSTGGTQSFSVTFRNVTARGGGSLVGKTSATLSGQYLIRVENSYITGNWNANVNSSVNGLTSQIIFKNNESIPSVVQTLSSGQGNTPLNIEYVDYTFTGYQGVLNRNFVGTLGNASQTVGIKNTESTDLFKFLGSLNASSGSISCPIFVVSPYVMQLTGVEIDWKNNTANTVVINVWSDSTKTTQLATLTTASASGQYQCFSLATSSILANYQITSASNPLYVEFVAASNAGFCTANVGLKFRQVN